MKRRLLLGTLALCFGTLFLASCHGNQSALNSAGIQAARIERLWWLIFSIILGVYVAVLLWLGAALWRRKTTASLNTFPPPQKDLKPEPGATFVVGGAIGLTVVLLFVILTASVLTGHAIANLNSKNPISIDIVGHQWWWEVRYEATQADQTVVTANEIHIPVGQPVVIKTSSADVIHSFWAPNLHGKRDLIPGYENALWIQADREGTFRGQCAEFCGHQHAHMAFFVIAEPLDKFNTWLAGQVSTPPSPVDPLAKQGEQVFLTHTCVMCHTIRGSGAGAKLGPDLTHLASRTTIAAGTLPNNRGNLAGWILDSQSIKPGNKMPPNPLKSDDLNALLTYLQTLH
jgi:cytochrome c oxidase subunit 2